MKTIINYYRFDISDITQNEEYLKLSTILINLGLKKFDSIAESHHRFYNDLIKPLNGQEIELETEFLFNNQWNTGKTQTSEKGFRVFDWSEPIYPNRDIKEGMYLLQTPGMIEVRKNTCKCGYCGKQYYKPNFDFCTDCLGSEYLKVNDLFLLKLENVSFSGSRAKNTLLPENLILKYNEMQKTGRLLRLKKSQDYKLKSIEQDILKSKKEFKAFKLLIDNNIDFNNVIYYSHTDTFCFGWRNPVENKEELSTQLDTIGFSKKYNVQIK